MLTYTNRKNDTFCIQKVGNEKGTYNYRVIKYTEEVLKDNLLDSLSPQYEFYEQPFDGKVIIRKKIHSIFEQGEIDLVMNVLIKAQNHEYFQVEKHENYLMVYVGTLTKQDKNEMKNDEIFHRAQWFHEKIKISKTVEGIYQVLRYSNLLQFSNWIVIGSSKDLKALVEKFAPHVNNDSLLDFWEEV